MGQRKGCSVIEFNVKKFKSIKQGSIVPGGRLSSIQFKLSMHCNNDSTHGF